ncbi:MAG: replication protein [Pasteurellaceae bacterium]|nr:replication protein [Pasteurellaceae bacterium]
MNALAKIKETRANLKLVPPTTESKKVSVDDGFTAIPNALLDAILESDLTKPQMKLVIGVIRKTLSWHKEVDWICNDQLAEICRLCDAKEASRIKNELIRINVLLKEGKKIGLNLVVSEWKSEIQQKHNVVEKREKNPINLQSKSNENTTTKETITKYKINNTPLTPQGEISVAKKSDSSVDETILADAKTLLAYYNELAKSTCRDAKPFVPLLTKTKTREAYSLEDIKLVLKWVLRTWERKNGSAAKPKNICRIERFDGYLSDAMAWQKNQSLYQGVIDAYNEILGDRLVPMNEIDTLAEKQIQGLLPHLKNPSVDAFVAYFETFAENAKPFYFEPERKFGFSFLMKPETLVKTRRQEL